MSDHNTKAIMATFSTSDNLGLFLRKYLLNLYMIKVIVMAIPAIKKLLSDKLRGKTKLLIARKAVNNSQLPTVIPAKLMAKYRSFMLMIPLIYDVGKDAGQGQLASRLCQAQRGG